MTLGCDFVALLIQIHARLGTSIMLDRIVPAAHSVAANLPKPAQ
jgi:hypothetical protein